MVQCYHWDVLRHTCFDPCNWFPISWKLRSDSGPLGWLVWVVPGKTSALKPPIFQDTPRHTWHCENQPWELPSQVFGNRRDPLMFESRQVDWQDDCWFQIIIGLVMMSMLFLQNNLGALSLLERDETNQSNFQGGSHIFQVAWCHPATCGILGLADRGSPWPQKQNVAPKQRKDQTKNLAAGRSRWGKCPRICVGIKGSYRWKFVPPSWRRWYHRRLAAIPSWPRLASTAATSRGVLSPIPSVLWVCNFFFSMGMNGRGIQFYNNVYNFQNLLDPCHPKNWFVVRFWLLCLGYRSWRMLLLLYSGVMVLNDFPFLGRFKITK